jgi:hypothetical protein
VHAQDQDALLGPERFYFLQRIEAGSARHGDVEHNEVPAFFRHLRNGFTGVRRFTELNFPKTVFENLFEPAS